MGIKGVQGTSLLDFPGRIASLFFWGGCNLTCPFCHNPALVLGPADYPDLDQSMLLEDLRHRQPFIDGVVLSGGEPTLDPGLPGFVEQVKGLGLAVKLDTNGLAPEIVRTLLERHLIDSLAIDLKTAPERYAELHPAPVDPRCLLETVALSREAGVQVEYRTTCVPGWVDEQTIRSWGEILAGAPLWALQQYHAEHALDAACRRLPAYPAERIRVLADLAADYVGNVVVRGL